MSEKQLILDAIDAAFKSRVVHMFEVLIAGLITAEELPERDSREEVFARFEKGMRLLLDARTSAREFWENEK